MEMTMDRRSFMLQMCLGGIATFALPGVTFAQVKQDGRFVFVLLRGGFDGLAAVVPFGDDAYARLRGGFSFEESELFALNELFGLAPGLSPLRDLWRATGSLPLNAWAVRIGSAAISNGQAISETGVRTPAAYTNAGWNARMQWCTCEEP